MFSHQHKMRCAFIDAIDVTSEAETRLPSLGLASIAAMLRERAGVHDVFIGDPRHMGELRSFSPDLLGVSSVTQNYSYACRLASKLKKEFNVPLIVGGPHISSLPTSLGRYFDIGVIGEGEQTMREIVLALRKGGLEHDTLKDIRGIVYRRGEKFEITPPRPLIKNLDDLPHPAFDLLEIGSTMHVVTSRGCPCRCAFCSSSRIWRKLRCHSSDYVMRDIKNLVERYGVRRINIMDDLFSADRKRLHEIADRIEGEKLSRRVFFACHARAEFVDDKICSELRRMGVQSITFGFESGSQRILSYLKGGGASVEKNLEAVRICRRAGLRACGSFIIGSPGEDKSDILKTLYFIRRSNISGGDIYVLVPYPGTRVWDYAMEKGLVRENMDWSTLQVESFDPRKGILLTDSISRDELYHLYIIIREDLKKRLEHTARYLYARDYRPTDMLSIKKLWRALRHPVRAISFIVDLLRYRLCKQGR